MLDTGVSKLSDQGIVVGLSSGATATNNFNKFSQTLDSAGKFKSIVINLPASTTFYVRAYGINSDGAGYGNEIIFTTGQDKIYKGNGPTLTTQKEVDDFGANNYTTLINGLEIVGLDIHDLSPLKSIIIIGGSLRVTRTSLVNLKGLENVEIIGNNFFNTSSVEDNSLLVNLSGLDKVKLINGTVQLARNSALVNFQGLNSLTHIRGGDLGIHECNSLRNLDGLEKLMYLDGTLLIQRNASLANIRGLKTLATVNDDIRIGGNAELLNVDGLESLKKLRFVALQDNRSLADINGLRNLTELSGFQLDQSEAIKEISALSNLKTCQNIDISRNNALLNLEGLSNIETITGQLVVYSNPKLVDMSGLEKLHTARTISIGSNEAMINLKGLDNLKVITESAFSLGISRNDALISLRGLENLTTVTGQMSIGFNKSLVDFCPLKLVMSTYTGDGFVTEGNAVVTDRNSILSACP